MSHDLPRVAGNTIRGTIAEFERSCLVHIDRLQNKLGDSGMIDTFCEAVRLTREYCHFVKDPDVLRTLTAENARLRTAVAQTDEISNHYDDEVSRNKELKQENARLREELENARAVIKSDCENESMIEEMVKPYLTDLEIHGDSYGVPGPVGIVETLCKKLEQARKDGERFKFVVLEMTKDQFRHMPYDDVGLARQYVDAAMNAESEHDCPTCNGMGIIDERLAMAVPCPSCHGTGNTNAESGRETTKQHNPITRNDVVCPVCRRLDQDCSCSEMDILPEIGDQ